MSTINLEIEWKQQARQMDFLRACGLAHPFEGGGPKPPVATVLLYGGAVGGGKSDALIVAALIAAISYPGCNIGYFRREYPQLEGPGGAIMRSHELFTKTLDQKGKVLLAKWHGGNRRWTFFNDSVVQFCHCKTEEDTYNYMSQQFDVLLFDESTQFTEFQLTYLITRNRATVNGITPFCAMATNPGGVSHGFHKKYFVDAGVESKPVDVEVQEGVYRRHIFIPALLKDNQVLEERDPHYRKKLEGMSEDVRRALLEGDWNVFTGQYFKTFRKNLHVVEPTQIPAHWRRFGSLDWGFAAPAAFLWHAIDPTMGRVYTYRELYVTQMRAAELAKTVKEMSMMTDDKGETVPEELAYINISPDAYRESGLGSDVSPGETVAEEFLKLQLNVEQADNRRVLGWQRMREFLAEAPDGKPWWLIFSNCQNLIRTMPELIHDKVKVEDVSGDCEDHGPEAARYFLMSRPSPNEGKSFNPGDRGAFASQDDEDDYYDDIIGEDSISFYQL